jgi:serine/threonine-protein kinase HipA
MGIDGAGNGGREKYQRNRGGGPGWRQAAGLLDEYSADADAELERLVAALTFTIAIGNADAHAKNLSLLHDSPTTIKLAPLYDTTPTLLWPKLTEESALSVNDRFPLGRLTLDDVVAEAASWPFERDATRNAAVETLERLRTAADALDSDELAALITSRCTALLEGRGAGA